MDKEKFILDLLEKITQANPNRKMAEFRLDWETKLNMDIYEPWPTMTVKWEASDTDDNFLLCGECR
jgi:hypothetical protein